MRLIASVLCICFASATSTSVVPTVVVDPPPTVVVDPPPTVVVDPPPPGTYNPPNYGLPPFPQETQCFFFAPCNIFPTEPICTLPRSTCGGAFTFANSCYLDVYNCEHESNQYYQYSQGECYPNRIDDPPPNVVVL